MIAALTWNIITEGSITRFCGRYKIIDNAAVGRRKTLSTYITVCLRYFSVLVAYSVSRLGISHGRFKNSVFLPPCLRHASILASLTRLEGPRQKAMHSPLLHVVISCWTFLYSFVNCAAPLNKPFVPPGIIHPQPFNKSTSLGGVPPYFDARIEETARGPPVSVIFCLETGLFILGAHLAIESFTGRIRTPGWTTPHVVMAVSTQGVPGNSIERRFVIWGIFSALCQMRGQEDFRSAIWTLRMRGEVVGYLGIHPRDLDTIDNRDKSVLWTELDPTLSATRSDTNGSVTTDSDALEAGRLRVTVSVLVPARPVDLYGVLLNLVGTIVEAAEIASSGASVIRDRLISNTKGSHIQVLITPGRDLTYRLLIEALTLIPSKLAEARIREAFQADVYLSIVKAATIQVQPGGS